MKQLFKIILIAFFVLSIAVGSGMACRGGDDDDGDTPAPSPEPSIDPSAYAPGTNLDADSPINPAPKCTLIEWIMNNCGEEEPQPNVPAE